MGAAAERRPSYLMLLPIHLFTGVPMHHDRSLCMWPPSYGRAARDSINPESEAPKWQTFKNETEA